MEKSAKQGNKDAVKFVDGTVKLNDKEKPLEFAQLKQIYNEIVLQVTELLQQLDPATSSKLLNKSRVPKTLPLSSEGSDEECDIEQSELTDYKESLESLSQLSGEESEAASTTSIIRGDAPKTTKFIPLIPLLAPVVAPFVATAGIEIVKEIASTVGDLMSPEEPENPAEPTVTAKPKPIEVEDKKPDTPLQQSPDPPSPPSMIPPHHVPDFPYLQNIHQQYMALGQTPFGLKMPPQGPYQPQFPFPQGVPAMYPQVPYLPQNPPAYGVPTGYPQGLYQPQNTPPPAYGVPTGYPQGLYQPQNTPPSAYGVPAGYTQGFYQPQKTPPPAYGVPVGYPQGFYQPQSPPGQWQSVQPSYPQSYYQQQSFPQPFGQHPRLWSPKSGLSPSHIRSQKRGLNSYSLSPSSTPRRSPMTTRSVPSYSPSEYGLTSFKMPADRKGLRRRSPAFNNLEGEVLKSLKDIDDQLNVILTKLEQK